MAGNDNKLVTLADLGAAYTALSATATTSANGMMSSTDKTKLEGIESGAQINSITGVKGDSENDYRTGNVNVTPANIGAVSTSSIANNLTTTTAGSVLDAAQGKALKDSVDILPCYVLDCGTVSSLPKTIPSSGTNANITGDMVVLKAVFGTPSAQTSDWAVTANDGNLVISGSISGSTTLKLYLMKSR